MLYLQLQAAVEHEGCCDSFLAVPWYVLHDLSPNSNGQFPRCNSHMTGDLKFTVNIGSKDKVMPAFLPYYWPLLRSPFSLVSLEIELLML
jgi:hypothetical protein